MVLSPKFHILVVYRHLYCIIKNYKEYRKWKLQPNSNNIVELDFSLKIKERTPQALYGYYWLAEQIQYFNMRMIIAYSFTRNEKIYKLEGKEYATLPLSYDFDDYMTKVIKSPERALVRKAIKNGYKCMPIVYDNYLEEIICINTEKSRIQGKQIGKEKLPAREFLLSKYAKDIKTYGCFSSENKLVAYFSCEMFTNFYHVTKFITHPQHQNMGVSNFLFAFAISELSKNTTNKILIYGPLAENKDNFSHFRSNIGTKANKVYFRCTSKDIQNISYMNSSFHLHGDTSVNYVLDYIQNG